MTTYNPEVLKANIKDVEAISALGKNLVTGFKTPKFSLAKFLNQPRLVFVNNWSEIIKQFVYNCIPSASIRRKKHAIVLKVGSIKTEYECYVDEELGMLVKFFSENVLTQRGKFYSDKYGKSIYSE